MEGITQSMEVQLQRFFVINYQVVVARITLNALVRDLEEVEMVKGYSIDSGEVSWIELTPEVKKKIKILVI